MPQRGYATAPRPSPRKSFTPHVLLICWDWPGPTVISCQISRPRSYRVLADDPRRQTMAKVIFVLQRKPGMTRQECSRTWGGDQHTSTVSKIPGLTRWVQNHVISAPGDPVCDGIGELWFDSDEVMNSALGSPQMAAAVEDARTFLDMDNTGLVIVEERPIMARGHDRAAGSPAPDKEMKIAYAKLADQLVDAWNSLDPQRVVDLLTEDHIYEDVTFAVVCRGAAETRGFFQGAYSAFPDIHFTRTS